MNEKKICTSCKEPRELVLFGKCLSTKDGLRYDCKICRKKYREENKEKIKEKQRLFYEKNKDTLIIKNKEYREKNKETINIQRKEYRNREEVKEHIKQKNIEYLPIKKMKIKEKRKNDINFRISESLRSKFHKFIKGKKTSLSKNLGCDLIFLKKWIEFNFTEEMTWDNYGKWEIDHVIPLSKFNFSENNDIKICYNWTNLKPLIKKDNTSKSNKIIKTYIYDHINQAKEYIKQNTNFEYQTLEEMTEWLREKLRYGKNLIDDNSIEL